MTSDKPAAPARLDTHADQTAGGRDQTGLLPSGLSDQLFPHSAQNAEAKHKVISCFTHAGYQLVKPPLVEFEDTLIDDALGESLSTQTFRLLDPISRRMMALRADMTAQVARISGTRLAHLPRPLRLAYYGDVMRVVPDVLNPERQIEQVGAEIIGRDDDLAVAEIIMLGVQALKSAGVTGLTIDLSLPRLAEVMTSSSADSDKLMQMITQKDSMGLRRVRSFETDLIADIIDSSGNTPDALAALLEKMEPQVASSMASLLAVHAMLAEIDTQISITLDPMDRHGALYHTRIGFSIYAEGVRGPIASGGSYHTGYNEPAIGLSVYMERVLKILPDPTAMPKLYIPASIGLVAGRDYIARGRQVVFGSPNIDEHSEALALGCQFILRDADGQPEPLS